MRKLLALLALTLTATGCCCLRTNREQQLLDAHYCLENLLEIERKEDVALLQQKDDEIKVLTAAIKQLRAPHGN